MGVAVGPSIVSSMSGLVDGSTPALCEGCTEGATVAVGDGEGEISTMPSAGCPRSHMPPETRDTIR